MNLQRLFPVLQAIQVVLKTKNVFFISQMLDSFKQLLYIVLLLKGSNLVCRDFLAKI